MRLLITGRTPASTACGWILQRTPWRWNIQVGVGSETAGARHSSFMQVSTSSLPVDLSIIHALNVPRD